MEKNRLAVFLIDMQDDFILTLPPHELERIVPNQIHIIRLCKQERIPFFVLHFCHEEHGELFKKLRNEIQTLDTHLVSFIEKKKNDGFLNTNLKEKLFDLSIFDIFVMGINAHACVRETVEHGMKYFNMIISADVISGRNFRDFDSGMNWYRDCIYCIDNVKEIQNLRIACKELLMTPL